MTQDLIQAGAVLVGGIALAQGVNVALVRIEGRRGDLRGARVLGRLVRLAVVVVALIYALAQVGVRIGPLVAAAGVGGVALAFAVRSIFENFLAGILLLLRRPFHAGDEICSGDFEGTVEDVNLRAVVLRTFDGRRVFLPNGGVLNSAIVNLTAYDLRRSEVIVGVGYEADVVRASDVLRRAVAEVDGVATHPSVEAWARELASSSVEIAVRFWHGPRTAEEWRVRHAVIAAAKLALADAEIGIPFDQLTVRMEGEG